MRKLIGTVIQMNYEQGETRVVAYPAKDDNIVAETRTGNFLVADPPKVFLKISSNGEIFRINVYSKFKELIHQEGRKNISEKIARRIFKNTFLNRAVSVFFPDDGGIPIVTLLARDI